MANPHSEHELTSTLHLGLRSVVGNSPADLITESFPGQFRNWFYSLLAMSTVMVERAPTRTVFGYGLVFAEDGRQMHKSWGNAIEFDEAAELLLALECVDAAVIFDEDTPHDIIAALQPDVLVKGADWPLESIIGRDVVESRGGRVERITFSEGYSTTGLIQHARRGFGNTI